MLSAAIPLLGGVVSWALVAQQTWLGVGWAIRVITIASVVGIAFACCSFAVREPNQGLAILGLSLSGLLGLVLTVVLSTGQL
jgi:hypothetical protein